VNKQQAFEKLHSIGQSHVLKHYDSLTTEEQQNLLAQIDSIHIPTFRLQQQILTPSPHPEMRFLDPVTDTVYKDHGKWINQGKTQIAKGKVGCLIIAGGQASRLRYDGPKGCFPVSVIKNKPLFQLFAEKTLAAGRQAGTELPLAIMTSPLNHEQTVQCFEHHNYFGLNPSQVSFFSQAMLPLLNHEHNLFLDRPGRIAMGPDGNGSCFRLFFESGIWKKWYDSGVRLLNTVLVDNPLADPFDAELIGFHSDENADVVIKCTTRRDAEEKVGMIVKHADHTEIVEYSEIPEKERLKRDSAGELVYNLANLGLFSFSLDFIKSMAFKELPLHPAHKRVPSLQNPEPESPNAWKLETFIFDVLPYALKVKTFVCPRKICFAPLKNCEGQDSLQMVQEALQKRDRSVFASISETTPPERPFELSQDFYYPTPEFLERWKNRPLPGHDYID
jgi:UDP-N-acetylglucosamine/UDP-N-acetylgalactosamine diphosphorylase